VLLCGDFNARSWLWDPRRENRRGEVLSEWAAEMDLRLLNVGGVSTCVRPQGVSVVDLSWVSPGLAGRVTGWSVLEGVETLSDHLYIKFGILPSGSTGGGGEGHSGVYPRWDFSKLRPDDLTASLEERCAFGPGEAQAATAEGLAGWVSQTMARACDDSAPRSRFCRVGGGRRASSVYWWTEEIAGLRRACLRARRSFTRCRRRGSRVYCECCAVFRLAKRDLRKAIIAAKIRAWEDLVRSVEEDPWGLPYKLVLKRLRRSSPALTETLGEDELAEMLDSLFPRPPERDWVEPRREFAWDPSWACDEGEVLEALKGKARAGNPAPGSDGIPAGIWRKAPMAFIRVIVRLFNRCLMEGIFPADWRRARLVFVPKGGAEPAGPLRARPICLLNEIGKIFERVLVGRVERWMADHPSASFSDSQYGFRAGRSTVDALLRVRDFVSRAVQGGGAAVAVGLDVVNAFNSVPRSHPLHALWEKGLPLYLRRVVGCYLSERTVEFSIRGGGVRARDVVAGVPQGSVLGPLLWNVVYDRVFSARLEPGYEVICYADDTLVL
ncbi:Putative 115 kDa protein in type-1 retrotransposable element R1DM, partial [Harpegnathos saltator]